MVSVADSGMVVRPPTVDVMGLVLNYEILQSEIEQIKRLTKRKQSAKN